MVRSIFRVIEYIRGREGYLQSKMVFLYAFDVVLRFGVIAILNVVHPSEIGGLLKGNGPRRAEAASDSEMQALLNQPRARQKANVFVSWGKITTPQLPLMLLIKENYPNCHICCTPLTPDLDLEVVWVINSCTLSQPQNLFNRPPQILLPLTLTTSP